jgi:hypothetical protein
MIAVFMSLLILPTVVWGVLKTVNVFAPSIMEILDFDTGERETRNLAEFPKKFDPETFTAEVENWYNDHLPFRSVIYTAYNNTADAIEEPYEKTLRPALIELFYGNRAGQIQGGQFELDLGEDESSTELETLPEFETDGGDIDCNHVLSSESIVIKAASCTEYGVIGYECENCDYVKKEYSHKEKHNYISSVEDPTVYNCGKYYDEVLTCSKCQDTYEQRTVKKHTPKRRIKKVEPSTSTYGYILTECADCQGKYRTNITNKLYDLSYLPPTYHGDRVTEGREKWLFFRGNDSELYYCGTNLMTEEELIEYAMVMSRLQALCDDKGITLQLCVWPNKDQVYSEYMPTLTIKTDYNRIERLVDYMRENTSVKMIYPLEELIAAKPYNDTYLKFDTHWNCFGGFVGYQEMLKSLGLETMDYKNVPVFEHTGKSGEIKDPYYTQVSGDMIGIGQLSSKQYNGDHNYYIDYRPETEVYTREGGNGANDIRYTTSNGPFDYNFVLIGDSYRVMQLTYLERDFTDCYLMHRTHAAGVHNNQRMSEEDYNVVKRKIREADILVLCVVERVDTEALSTARTLIKILQEQ